MPEMTAMPILPVALAPANTAQAASSRPAPAEDTKASVFAQKTGGGDASPVAAAAQKDGADSFAQVLQKQLAQTADQSAPAATQAVAGTAIILPIDMLTSGITAPAQPGDSLPLVAMTQPVPVDELALDPAQDQTIVTPPSEAGQIQALTANTQALTVNTQAVAPEPQLLSGAEPVGISLPVTPSGTGSIAKGDELLAKLDDDHKSAEMAANPANDLLAAQLPYLLGMTAQATARVDRSQPVTENASATDSDTSSQLPGTSQLLNQAYLAAKELPTKIAETTQAAADKAAEIAVALPLASEATPAQTSHGSAAIDSNFENLLAAAQAFNQERSAATHATNHAATSLPVTTPVGTRGWNDDVSNKLVWMIGRQEQRAELILNPPQLGRVEVSLTMSDGQTNALFVSANPAVRDALEAALPRLREMLADAGVTLGQAQVGADSGSNSAANQSTNQKENWDNSGRAMNRLDPATGLENLRPLASSPWLRQTNGLVDVFA